MSKSTEEKIDAKADRVLARAKLREGARLSQQLPTVFVVT
jgi:hypothetical protein